MKKIDVTSILRKYTNGEATAEETNEALKEAGSSLYIDPMENVLTEEEMRMTTVGYYPEQANGYGMLDTGTGYRNKARVVNGKFDHILNEIMPDGKPNCRVDFIILGRTYAVHGDKLVNKE